MLAYFSAASHQAAEWWSWWSLMVGTITLCLLIAYFVSVIIKTFRPIRLLDRLSDRVVVITGCDSGFGESLARRLDSMGVPVVAGCLFPEGPGARRLLAECSSKLKVLPLDVTSEQQVRNAVTAVESSLGGRDLWAVVNNAAVMSAGYVELVPLEEFRRVLDVNTLGVIRVTQAFLPLLRRSQGRVVTIASPLGRMAMPFSGAYAVSKGATITFCDVLRIELEKWGVSVCTVLPGSYKSNLNNSSAIAASMSNNFKKCPASVIETYGEDFVKELEEITLPVYEIVMKPKSCIGEVVDELVDACIGTHFQAERIPAFKEKILLTVAMKLPISVWNRTFNGILRFWKKTKKVL